MPVGLIDDGRGHTMTSTTSTSQILSEALIRSLATPESFQRGHDYWTSGAVIRLSRRGGMVEAAVAGSRSAPYAVRATLDGGGVTTASCSCPYEWGGICKHIVAALLAARHQPEQDEAHAPLRDLLMALDRDQLATVLLDLAAQRPDLVPLIEARVVDAGRPTIGGGAAPPAPRAPSAPLDQASFRRQARAALGSLSRMRPSEAYWHAGGVVEDVRSLAEQARPYLEAGDGGNALLILEVVTQEYVEGWMDLDDSDGEAGELFAELGELWAEALLTAGLTAGERTRWAERLTGWAHEIADYGVDDAFDIAVDAARLGWDDPGLQQAMRGEAPARGSGACGLELIAVWHEDLGDDDGVDEYLDELDEDDEFGDEDEFDEDSESALEPGASYGTDWRSAALIPVRLRILEREGRFDEYLNLAAASGQHTSYAHMLVRLGRTADAVKHGLNRLTDASEALALATALHERGAVAEALRVGEHGLDLAGHPLPLARWLRDQAAAAGKKGLALTAAGVALDVSLALDDYRATRALAGKKWPAIRDVVLARVRSAPVHLSAGAVAILLDEGMIDDAIAIADAQPHAYDLLERVVDAATASHPDWVIGACHARAERIMDAGKSNNYHYAATWLGKARAAAVASGRLAEWQGYLSGMIALHKRKTSLVPLLERLR